MLRQYPPYVFVFSFLTTTASAVVPSVLMTAGVLLITAVVGMVLAS